MVEFESNEEKIEAQREALESLVNIKSLVEDAGIATSHSIWYELGQMSERIKNMTTYNESIKIMVELSEMGLEIADLGREQTIDKLESLLASF